MQKYLLLVFCLNSTINAMDQKKISFDDEIQSRIKAAIQYHVTNEETQAELNEPTRQLLENFLTATQQSSVNHYLENNPSISQVLEQITQKSESDPSCKIEYEMAINATKVAIECWKRLFQTKTQLCDNFLMDSHNENHVLIDLLHRYRCIQEQKDSINNIIQDVELSKRKRA